MIYAALYISDICMIFFRYRPAAKRGAILFFVLSEMSTISSMYQYSLAAYLDVFEFSLRKSMPDTILQKRLRNIMDTLTHNVYNYGCTGIVFLQLTVHIKKLFKLTVQSEFQIICHINSTQPNSFMTSNGCVVEDLNLLRYTCSTKETFFQ